MLRLLTALFMLLLILPTLAVAEPDYSTPEATFKTYLEACKKGDKKAVEDCYTESSRAFIANHPAITDEQTPEQLVSSYEHLSKLNFAAEKVNSKRAILRTNEKEVPPLYLRVQNPSEGWRIDWRFMRDFMQVTSDGWTWRNPKAETIWKSRL